MKKLNLLIAVFAMVLIFGIALFVVGYGGLAGLATAQEVVEEIPFLEEWAGSGHNDAAAEAFVHWDEDDPAEVPEACARCHSTPGYQDWIGADGTEAGVVEAPAAIGSTIECVACHNDVTLSKTTVTMPSGIELANLGDESRCMECHQGRHSTVSVNESITEAGVTDDDTVSEDLGFLNIHYYARGGDQVWDLSQRRV